MQCNSRNTSRASPRSRLLEKALALLTIAHGAYAGAGQFSIPWSTIDSGGGVSAGGSFSLQGTIGQSDASLTPAISRQFALNGGFWFALAPCLADLDGDGVVGGADLAILLGDWGPALGSPADFTGDGVVDGADLAILLGAWGPC